jgi:hypothetical protein
MGFLSVLQQKHSKQQHMSGGVLLLFPGHTKSVFLKNDFKKHTPTRKKHED